MGRLHRPMGSYGISRILLGLSSLSRGRSYGQQDFLDFVFRPPVMPTCLAGSPLYPDSNLYLVDKESNLYFSVICWYSVCISSFTEMAKDVLMKNL